MRAVHIAGSYWAPGFANYLLLLQVFINVVKHNNGLQATDIFTYNMTHCPGVENTATASALLHTIVRFLAVPSNLSNFWESNLFFFRLVERAADQNPTLKEIADTL